jgi:hypothetical protein
VTGCPTRNDGHWTLDGWQAVTAADDSSRADPSPHNLGEGVCGTDPEGGSNHGTVTGMYPAAGARWTTGRVAEGVRLDGTGQGYVSLPQSPIRTDWAFTVSAWVLVEAPAGSGWHAAVSQIGNVNSGFYLEYNATSGEYAFAMSDSASGGAVTYVRAPKVTSGWTHLTGTYDPYTQKMRLFVNGREADVETFTYRWHASQGLQIGRAKYGGNVVDPWHGGIDDVRVYQRALPPAEIQKLATLPAVEEAFYPFDDASAMGADQSGGYRNATIGSGGSREDGPVDGGALRVDGTANGWAATTGPVVRTDNSFTVSAWARPDVLGSSTDRTVISQDGQNVPGFKLYYRAYTGAWTFRYYGSDSVSSMVVQAGASDAAQVAEWVHLVGVFDVSRSVLELYVDGALRASTDLNNVTPWHAAGGLQVGRQLWLGARVGAFQGAIDHVQLWTGTLNPTDVQALYESYLQGSAPRTTVHTGQLARYLAPNGDHFSTDTGLVPVGYRFEGSLGLPAPQGASGTRQLYACMAGTDEFTSTDPICGGQRVLGKAALVYASAPVGVPTVGLYRCRTAGGERFDSNDAACEGKIVDEHLGYTRAYRYLVRHVKKYLPNDHRSDVVGVTPGYWAEGRLGIVALTSEPDTRSLRACYDGADEFTSTDPGCEGKQVRHWLGNAWTVPPPQPQDSRLLYRCRTSATGEFFDSLDPACEGLVVDRELGYIISSF